MKRTFANRPNWPRILDRSFTLKYLEEYKGYVSLIEIHNITEPLVLNMQNKQLKIVDVNYKWLQFYPDEGYYSLTVIINEQNEVVEYYFDITLGINISEDGIPYYDDIYLDVVLTPTSDILLLDEDELMEALSNNDITKDQYDLAYREANNLIHNLIENKDSYPLNHLHYLELLKKA